MRESEECRYNWPHCLPPWPLNYNLPMLLLVISKAKTPTEKLNDGWEVNVETPTYWYCDSIWVSKSENAENGKILTCIPHTNKNCHVSHIQTKKVQWTLDRESVWSVWKILITLWQILIAGCNIEAPFPNRVQIYFLRIPQSIHTKYFNILETTFWNLQDQQNVCIVRLMTPRWTDGKWNPLIVFRGWPYIS